MWLLQKAANHIEMTLLTNYTSLTTIYFWLKRLSLCVTGFWGLFFICFTHTIKYYKEQFNETKTVFFLHYFPKYHTTSRLFVCVQILVPHGGVYHALCTYLCMLVCESSVCVCLHLSVIGDVVVVGTSCEVTCVIFCLVVAFGGRLNALAVHGDGTVCRAVSQPPLPCLSTAADHTAWQASLALWLLCWSYTIHTAMTFTERKKRFGEYQSFKQISVIFGILHQVMGKSPKQKEKCFFSFTSKTGIKIDATNGEHAMVYR